MDTRDFLELVFGDNEGYLFISSKSDPASREVDLHKPFKYPENLNTAVTYIKMREDEDLYFSPMLYKVPRRKAISVCATPVLYADTDTFDPAGYLVQPSINIVSSPGHLASLWLLDDKYSAEQVQAASRAIAMTHARKENGKQVGVDPSGWDLTQLLRLPPSTNLKYRVVNKTGTGQEYPDYTEAYPVTLGESTGNVYSLAEITEAYDPSKLPAITVSSDSPIPTDLPDVASVLRRVTASPRLSKLYNVDPKPGQDWSDTMYRFVSELFREGFTPEEVLVIGWQVEKFNKFRRDDRPIEDFWQYDVLKAYADPENRPRATTDREPVDVEPHRPKDEGLHKAVELALLTEEERGMLTRTFVDDYSDWAASKTDAPVAYHIASAFTILSCILGEWGIGDPQFGDLRLGLFFVVMGETTDTRKSTARNKMKEILRLTEVGDFHYILTSDATSEALIDTLADRAHQSSLYDRDEAQQLIEDIKGGKGYLKGFFEALNLLYDGRSPGRLRMGKQTQETPVNFVQYLMGIRSQIQDNLEKKDFASGWGPRNIWVRGEAPPRTRENSRLRQGSRESRGVDTVKHGLVKALTEARNYWSTYKGNTREDPRRFYFEEDAWIKATDFEWDLKEYFRDHPRYDVLKACFERLTINVMKVAILFAMMAKRDEVSMVDVLNARYYAAQWVEDLVIVVEGVNESIEQRNIDRLSQFIIDNEGLVTYAKALKWATHEGLKKRDFLEYVDTLIETDVITAVDYQGKKCLEYNYG